MEGKSIRILDRGDLRGSELPPRRCKEPGCARATRERKPFCTLHVENTPYVAALLQALAGREREHEAVLARGAAAVDLEGITAQEILNAIGEGERSLRALARDLGLEAKLVAPYVEALEAAGRLSTSRVRRRRRVAILVSPLTPQALPEPSAALVEPALPLELNLEAVQVA